MRDFRKIQVWEKSHKLTLQLYKITSSFPKEELYGLTSQIRRAAGSIPANIAEGCGRNTQTELEYHLILAHDLGYIDSKVYPALNESINEIKRMLNGFEKTVQFNAKNA